MDSKIQAKWLLKSYCKNGEFMNRFEHLHLDIEENTMVTTHSEDKMLWPKEATYEKVGVMSGNYFHRSDGKIFEVKYSSENELHIDVLEKDMQKDQVNSHLFHFFKFKDN